MVGIESWSRNGPTRMKLYSQQFGLTFPFLFYGPLYGYYALGSPTIYVLDRKARFVGYWSGTGANWRSEAFNNLIRSLLAETR